MSNQERIEGAKLIEDRIREECSRLGKSLESINWNLEKGGQLSNFSSHTIHATINGKELTLSSIPDEKVMDYPGGAGTEVLDAHIRELCCK